jgi:folate-binding protein YgfZ
MSEDVDRGDPRATAGLFPLDHAGLVEIAGEDRTTWLNGMISNDVARLEPGRERSGCHAALLTNRGAIVADLHVVERGDRFWMLVERSALSDAIAALEKFIVADDVTLEDVTSDWRQWSLEGPAAPAVLEALGVDATLADGAGVEVEIAGQPVVLVAVGVTGEWARRVIAPTRAQTAVEAALLDAGVAVGLVSGDAETLEMLRIEAGVPRQGLELDQDVLPDEARLDSAISTTKGCYVGQEIVARLRSRGQVNHLLVGLCFEGEAAPVGAELLAAGKRTGEVTSVAESPRVGPIGLGYVRREHSEPGTSVEAGGRVAKVVALPFVDPTAPDTPD